MSRLEFGEKVKKAAITRANGYPRAKSKNFKWLESVVRAPKTDDCIEWPFAKRDNGYGQIFWRGTKTTQNRVVCVLAHGEPIHDTLEAAHECGNKSCCNPSHITWKTHAANIADKLIHGTHIQGSKIPWSKLTEADIPTIRGMLASGVSMGKTAKTYGVAKGSIEDIKYGRSWKHVP